MERLKVLISAYACEPGKGSEPEVGWQWALQMARFHDVTVLTRANNEAAITEALKSMPPGGAPRFAFFDLRAPLPALKKRFGLHDAYHSLWQRAAHRAIGKLLRNEKFDLLHHVTFAGARYPTAVLGHGIPCIFGPVGGLESMPSEFLPWRYPRALIQELARNGANAWQKRGPGLRRKLSAASLVIASTLETQRVFARLGIRSRLLPAIGLHPGEFPAPPAEQEGAERPLRLLFVGRLLYWKGLDLALRALGQSNTDATLAIIGEGEFRPAAERLAHRLKLENRVEFLGRMSRPEVLRAYARYDAFLYPSLHESGGFTLLEAMASGCPAICVKYGGPELVVPEETGFPVPLGRRASVVESLARAIRELSGNPSMRRAMGQKAREHIRAEYDWARKGEAMNRLYLEVTRPAEADSSPTRAPGSGGAGAFLP